MIDFQIRFAANDDAIKIKPLMIELQNMHHQIFPLIFKNITDIPNEEVITELEKSDYFLVAVANDDVIGYLKGIVKKVEESSTVFPRTFIAVIDLIIEIKYRNYRIGSSMLSRLENLARIDDIDSIEIPVYSYNESAISFYNNNEYFDYVIRKTKKLRINGY